MKLCIDHKLTLVTRGYGSADAIHACVPTARGPECDVCNGTWRANHQSLAEEKPHQTGVPAGLERVFARGDVRATDFLDRDAQFGTVANPVTVLRPIKSLQ